MKKIYLGKKEMQEGSLVLVNSAHPVAAEGRQRLLEHCGAVHLDPQAATMLAQLLREIGHDREIAFVSGYRTAMEQEEIYRNSILENGEVFTQQYVALPGRSEHQTGLAIDLGENGTDLDFIRPSFPHEGIYGRFREKASRFGFIERYKAGKEAITGISMEPWHFRYIGFPHAQILEEKGLCLEEYIDFLKQFPITGKPYIFSYKERQIEISYIPTNSSGVEIEIAADVPYQISGNNVDGYILTLWRGMKLL